jgi:hypothetical protein
MNDPAAYPRPVPLSQEDALALATTVGQWPDVPGTFLAYEMIGLEERIGEWRFAGAARSLAGAFQRIVEFHEAFGSTPDEARAGLAELIGASVLDVLPRLEDGWSTPLPYQDQLRVHRVVFFGEGGAPYDYFGLCILEVEPEDGEPFFARAPETHRPDEWSQAEQWEQQRKAARPDSSEASDRERSAPEDDSGEIPF